MFDKFAGMAAQAFLDDCGVPLSSVEFCAVDLETTGGSAATCAITEIGAVKVVRGEVTGTFQTLVNPGQAVPAFVRLLTGISDDLLVDAPPIEAVLPSFLEFSHRTVLVAHNARFDVSFLNAALERSAYPRLSNRVIDTAGLARKILAGEVPNRRLDTLARHLRCAHLPTHRAYADALATIDVLHYLIERVAGFGVTTLEDLLAMSTTRMDGTFDKIAVADDLPSGIGVYRFLGATGKTLYVGKATDVRTRVRSYFYGDPRRKIRDLLRETQSVSAQRHATTLEAEVAEARAIAGELPPYNMAGKRAGAWYLKLSVAAKHPRMAPCRIPKDDGSVYAGPFTSLRVVRTLMDALRDCARVHRCSNPAACHCPWSSAGACLGRRPDLHRAEIERLAAGITSAPSVLLEPLAARLSMLAKQQRFEEAAELRDRAALLQRVLRRGVRVHALVEAGDLVLGIGGRAVLIRGGRLCDAVDVAPGAERESLGRLLGTPMKQAARPWLTPELSREAAVISSWLDRHAAATRVLFAEHPWSLPVAAAPENRFSSKPGSLRRNPPETQ